MRLHLPALPSGKPGSRRALVVLTAVLGLSGADLATLSATADGIERTFDIGNTAFGLLVSVVTLVGGLCTVPAGVLVDRFRRTRMLAVGVAVWSVAMALSGAAQSYVWLLLSRATLGALIAIAGPTVASLTGDYFPARHRGRVYSLILSGELIGTGLGVLIAGQISGVTSWRVAMWVLVPMSLLLGWFAWRLPEPERSGRRTAPGGIDRDAAGRDPAGRDPAGGGAASRDAAGQDRVHHLVVGSDIEPRRELVLTEEPTNRSVWWAVRYVLRVRTNVVIIVVSALGYFFFSGLRSFAILFAKHHYGLSKSSATLLILVIGAGAIIGIFAGGRASDVLLRRGHIRGRVSVAVWCFVCITPIFAVAIGTTSLYLATPLFILAAALLGAPNPALDAARLDIIHPSMWGRAEGVRTVLRSTAETVAPVSFGAVSAWLGGTAGGGLRDAFLIFLIPLLAAGLLGFLALRTYPRDVATAAASLRAVADPSRN